MGSPWSAILPILERHGTSASVEEFHQQVNIHFHAVESRVYDIVHREMWDSLPAQFQLLAKDVLSSRPHDRKLRLLDIGCGTGLSSDLLLKSALGKSISDVCLLDTSREMLDRALARSANWNVRTEGRTGLLSDLPVDRYDVIVTCSVLHHIPILADFFSDISRRQGPGDFFLHLQDPNKDYQSDPQFIDRCAELRHAEQTDNPSRVTKFYRRWNPVHLTRRIISGPVVDTDIDYIAEVNRTLMEAGILRSPLTDRQIWTITDIHDAPDQSAGISLTEMRGWLDSYDMVSAHSYGFFGRLVSRLPSPFTRREVALRKSNAPNGQFLSASWRKKT